MDEVDAYLQLSAQAKTVSADLQSMQSNDLRETQEYARASHEYQRLQIEALQLLVDAVGDDPEQAFRFLMRLLDAKYQDEVYSLTDRVLNAHLPAVFEKSLPALGMTHKEAEKAGLSLHYKCLQALKYQRPELFHPYLETLWSDAIRTWGDWGEAWQDSGIFHMPVVIGAALTPRDCQEERCALACLEYTHALEAYDWLRETFGKTLLQEAGVEHRNGVWHKLYPEAAHHICLPQVEIESYHADPQNSRRLTDLSWRIQREGVAAQFWGEGGPICPECGNTPLQHALTLLHSVPVLPLRTPMTFVVCPMCMISDRPTYFTHDDQGQPARFDPRTGETLHCASDGNNPYQFSVPTIPVELRITPHRWYYQHLFNGHQNVSRVGGPPSWLQGPDWEICPKCSQRMMFIFQIGDGFVDANGIIYVFWCGDCHISAILNTYT